MSYIRCTSNPEGLYVIEEKKDIVFWWNFCEAKETQEARCDRKVFKSFMKKMKKTDGWIYDVIRHKDISIREVTALYKKRDKCRNKIVKIINDSEYPSDWLSIYEKYNTKSLVCLQIKNKCILLYDVTWKYFYRSYVEQNEI